MSTFLLLPLIIVVAAAGGFLGELLGFAGWPILMLAIVGAIVGFLPWAGAAFLPRPVELRVTESTKRRTL